MNTIYHTDALTALSKIEDASIDLIYVDPPFGTGNTQKLDRKVGTQVISKAQYNDRFDDYMGFLRPHIEEAKRVLKPTGTLYLHLDYRWVHYAKVACDEIFGRDHFLNEIIWAYDYGGRGKRKWPPKHDNILVYTKELDKYVFNWDDIDRIPYMAPGLQKDPAKAAVGKVPTDVWWMSIVGTQSKERNGYPTQKPKKLIERAVLASSPPDGVVLDFFAGSGSTGEAAMIHGRKFILVDQSDTAIETMRNRFGVDNVNWL